MHKNSLTSVPKYNNMHIPRTGILNNQYVQYLYYISIRYDYHQSIHRIPLIQAPPLRYMTSYSLLSSDICHSFLILGKSAYHQLIKKNPSLFIFDILPCHFCIRFVSREQFEFAFFFHIETQKVLQYVICIVYNSIYYFQCIQYLHVL